jgi:signal transduction histidine kinase
MKLRTNGIYLLLGLSVLLAFTSAFITYYNTLEKEQSMRTVIRRYNAIASSIDLLSLLKDMESGQRGYIISGDSDFLEPYSNAKAKIPAATDTLSKLVYDNEEQTNLIHGKIITAIQNKSEELENVINMANVHGKDTAAMRISTKIGKAYMDTLRILINDLIQREEVLLDIQNQKLAKNTRIEDNVRFFAFALIALTSLAAIVSLLRKRRHIEELIENLRYANDTLEKKVEERTKELVAANQAKDHFLSIASHDLKVPIAGISGLIRLMKSEKSSRSESDVEYLDYIEDACDNIQRLISNLLDINRIERGETTIKKEVVDVDKLLQKIKNEFAHHAQKKQIKFIVRPVEGTCYTDPDALQQILENLVSNAIKFSPPSKIVQLNAIRNNEQIRFEIIDQGPGISPEEIPDLFGKFKKLSNKPTGGEGSTGLGLSIVKEIVQLLGGEISVSSKLHEGSVFTVTI